MALNLRSPAPPSLVTPHTGGDHFSASQHKTFTMCQRKWWMEKVAKVKDNRPRTFLAVGKALHAVSERYLTQGVTTWDGLFPKGWDVGLLPEQSAFIRKGAKEAVELGVWAATPGVKIEEPIMYLVGPDFRDHRGLPLVVRPVVAMDKDGERKHLEPQAMLDGSPLPPGWNRFPRYIGFLDVLKVAQAKIEDHKSAKNRRYASTPGKLEKDGQLLSYTPLVFHLRQDITEVTIQHNVFLKDPEDKHPTYAVKAQVTLPMAVQHWDTIIADVQASQALRQRVVPDLSNLQRRADRYLEVPGAADEGPARIKEACEAYSGCPYKDMCMLRATAQQVVARMDALTVSAPPPPPVAAPTLLQRLAAASTPLRPFTTPTKPDAIMPFPPKIAPILVGQDVYLLDPENAAVQFRARLLFNEGGEMVTVALFPHVDVLPDFHKLSDMYRIEVPRTSLLVVADLTAKITGYQAALIAGGYNHFGTQWTTATGDLIDDAIKVARVNGGPQPLVNTASVPATSVQSGSAQHIPSPSVDYRGDPAVDHAKPATSTGAAQVAQMTRSQEAEAAANEAVPVATFTPQEGQYLIVAPTTHPFWSKHVGKTALVKDVTVGDGQAVVTVDIEGFDYPDVVAGRFVPADITFDKAKVKAFLDNLGAFVGEVKGMVPPKDPIFIQPGAVEEVRPSSCTPEAMPTLIAATKTMIGTLVKVMPAKGGPIIAMLEDAHSEGITMINGQVKMAWDQIVSIASGSVATATPGAKAPRLTKEQKAAIKEAEAAEAQAKAVQEAENKRIAERPLALVRAIGHLTEFLAGTKITRKMLETLQPLLVDALEHQGELALAQDELDGQVAAHQHTANDG